MFSESLQNNTDVSQILACWKRHYGTKNRDILVGRSLVTPTDNDWSLTKR